MSAHSRTRDESIRRAIRHNRRLRTAAKLLQRFMLLLIIGSICSGGFAVYRSWINTHQWRVTIEDNAFLLIEQGRPLPLLQFEPVSPDLPLLQHSELRVIGSEPPAVFDSEVSMNLYLASIYQRIGVTIDRSSLSGASRAVTILDAVRKLDPDSAVDDLAAALIDLSDRFASHQGRNNLPEAWLYLTQAKELLKNQSPASDLAASVDKKIKRLSVQMEKTFFHRIREHLLDGNYLAAETLLSELETCQFNHQQVTGFREQLNRLKETHS